MNTGPGDYNGRIMPDLESGDLLVNRYRLIREISRGGMGIVYLAEDMQRERSEVAIKALPPLLAGHADSIQQMKREAALSTGLKHPHLIRLFSMETDLRRGGMLFLVMEYRRGITARRILEDHSGGVEQERVLRWAGQVASALDYAHENRVLHRDIKPENIIVDDRDNAFLADFGIACPLRKDLARKGVRNACGTPAYMSLQQMKGEDDPANDIYSFAVTCYELLTGELPFTDKSRKHHADKGTVLFPDCLEENIKQALLWGFSDELKDRPSSATELARRLRG